MSTSSPCLALITGIGCVSPFGVGGRHLLAAVLRDNTTAIRPISNFPTHGLSRQLGAEVLPQYLTQTEEGRRWSRLSQMTVLACRQAVQDAELYGTEALHAGGLVVGSEFGDLRSTEAFGLGYLRKGPLGLSPLLFPSTVMNAMAGTVSIALGLKGSMLTVNEQDIAGETAAIRSGDPHHDDAELALLVATFGTAGPLVTGVTHLTGAYGGLGTWRLAAATTTLNVGLLPRLDYLQYPSHSDVRFATQPTPHAPAITLVYGLARGGMQTAMLLSRPRVTGNSHR